MLILSIGPPRDPTTLTDVGIFLMNHVGDLAEAEPLLRSAIALASASAGGRAPPSPAERKASVQLSYLLAAKGDVADALGHYGRGCPENVCAAGGLPLSADALGPLLRDGGGNLGGASTGGTSGGAVQVFRGLLPPAVVDGVRAGLAPASPFWAVNYNGKFRSYYFALRKLLPPAREGGVVGQCVGLVAEALAAHARPGSPLASLLKESVGVELWGHAKAYRRRQLVVGGHQLHFDEDHTYHSRTGVWRHPIATVIVYLSQSGVGGPLVVANATRAAPQPGGNLGWVVWPEPGLVAGFPGDRLHGVLPGFRTASQDEGRGGDGAHRVSLNIAFWRRGEACVPTVEECQQRPKGGFAWEAAMLATEAAKPEGAATVLDVPSVEPLYVGTSGGAGGGGSSSPAAHPEQRPGLRPGQKRKGKAKRQTPTAWEEL